MYVLQRIFETASETPRKLALVFNGYPLTYGTFWRFIAGVRRSLQPHLPDRGIALVWVDSLLECWILHFALRSLGLDVACLQSRDQVDLFQGLDVACVITLGSEPGKDVGTFAGMKHLVLSDPSKQAVAIDHPLPPLPEIGKPGNSIVLTSGTTGRHKKVSWTYGSHREAMDRRGRSYAEWGDRIVQPSDQSVFNIFNMSLVGGGHQRPTFIWCLGGAVVINQTEDPSRALTWPGVTHTLATPLYLSQLMALPQGAFPFLPEMQLFVTGGSLSPHLARESARRLTPKILIELASSEAGVCAGSVVEREADLRWYRPYAGHRIEVVSEAGEPLPVGGMGRVRIAMQDGDPTGYLDDPAATAAVFSDGWYYPGDLGVIDPEGRIALQGRVSDVVQVGGVKLPAEPWERTIRDKLGCEAVCVLSDVWRTGAEELHVFIESRRPIAAAALADALRSTLSGFAEFHAHVVDSLPRTASGKIRRIALTQQLRDGVFEAEAKGAVCSS